jgi:DNA invertase Pin-like site-specific DNA recombinase
MSTPKAAATRYPRQKRDGPQKDASRSGQKSHSTLRCAIYTRKSVDEGLDAAFTTLDNQREYCSSYIASQGGHGWIELSDRYDDGGFSGGNLNRPALARLRADIAAGKVDVVVVYKIDRLSRSLRDFANLVAEFEAHDVTFVSVTQAFDTSTAMGRLTLNVLLSFAQFERELTSERLKDFFRGAAARGRWIVGQRPFGYQIIDQILVVDPDEAQSVRMIFRLYIKLQSLRLVRDEMNRRGIKNRNGTPFTDTIIHRMLRNPVYLGNRRGLQSRLHAPIISDAIWQKANQVLVAGQKGRRGRRRPMIALTCLLRGKLIDQNGRLGIPSGRSRNGTYRYYIDNPYRQDGEKPSRRYLVKVVDRAVVAALDRLMDSPRFDVARSTADMQSMIDSLVKGVAISDDSLTITLTTGASISAAIKDHIPRSIAKTWRLMSPDGERFEFINLSLWLRSNAHRFSAHDMQPLKNYNNATRANFGIGQLRPPHCRRKSWKGWRWWHDDGKKSPATG